MVISKSMLAKGTPRVSQYHVINISGTDMKVQSILEWKPWGHRLSTSTFIQYICQLY